MRLARNFRGLAKADDARDVFRSRTEAALVMAAIKKLAQTRATANVESADALWTVELVSGEGEQVDSKLVHVNRYFSCRLHGVGVEIDVPLLGDASYLIEGLDGAELVVGVHDGDQHSFRPYSSLQFVEIDLGFTICREESNAHRVLFQCLTRVQHRFVFDGGGNDVGKRIGISGGGDGQECLSYNPKDG